MAKPEAPPEPFTSHELCDLSNYLDKKRWSELITAYSDDTDDQKMSRIVAFLRLAVCRIEIGVWNDEIIGV